MTHCFSLLVATGTPSESCVEFRGQDSEPMELKVMA
eukprot:COSAG04_NODE_9891_length_823_cov_1.625691_3_plen_35_part_01